MQQRPAPLVSIVKTGSAASDELKDVLDPPLLRQLEDRRVSGNDVVDGQSRNGQEAARDELSSINRYNQPRSLCRKLNNNFCSEVS